MSKTSTLRLRRVRFKDGRTLDVFRSPSAEDEHRFVREKVAEVLAVHSGRIAGMAFVVWEPDCSSTCVVSVNDSSTIPSILVPDFVRNRLLADRIERWTLDTVDGR